MGIVAEIILTFFRYKQALLGIADEELEYELIAPYSPMIVIASICIFAGFSYLNIRKDFGKLSELTFPIYLIHAGVWHILSQIIRKRGYGWNNKVVIPVCVIIIFIISAIIAKVYIEIWKRLERKWKISDKFCKIIHLQ